MSYAKVNGLNMYYEIHGSGKPLILLHGSMGTVDMFAQILPSLATTRQVIAVELQAHGHTADVDRPLSFEQMADDVAALIEQLGLEPADMLGYSMGGGVALQTAIRHPNLIRKLVIVSAVFNTNGWYAEARAGMKSINAQSAAAWIGSPMHQAYVNAAPSAEGWSALVIKIGQLVSQDYDWSAEVAKMKLPTLIVIGDADGFRTSHAVEFFELLGGGKKDGGWDGSGMSNARLAILPGTTHYNILASPLITPVVASFLD